MLSWLMNMGFAASGVATVASKKDRPNFTSGGVTVVFRK